MTAYSFFIALVFCILNCSYGYSQDSHYVNFDRKLLGSNDCSKIFTINGKFIKNKEEREILQKLLYRAFIDEERCDSIPEKIFTKKSYAKLVLSIFHDTTFYRYSIYDYVSRWKESYSNLIEYCTNDKILVKLSNELLKSNFDEGIVALFGNTKFYLINKIKFIKKYSKKNKNDFYRISLLSVVYHNNGDFEIRDKLLVDFSNQERENIIKLFNHKKNIDYTEYLEVVFGGV